ncbi:TetR/AcrR family transcriptional regulator [Bdellovibrio sp.]|uniref:TetR/AcrR family transcriptional regulator n=1 Tax=Bdellovibrio sp. TaxID=28201 RepID=UPI0039E33435
MKISKGERTRENILLKALELYAEKGVQNTPFQNIADAVGITQAALYKYFSDRDELLKEAILLGAQRGRDFFASKVPDNLNAKESLLIYVEKNLEWCSKGQPFHVAFLSLHYFATQVPSIKKVHTEVMRARLAKIQELLLAGQEAKVWKPQDLESTAMSIHNYLLGEMFSVINNPQMETKKARNERVSTAVLKLVKD